MSRFIDKEELRHDAKERLAQRQGKETSFGSPKTSRRLPNQPAHSFSGGMSAQLASFRERILQHSFEGRQKKVLLYAACAVIFICAFIALVQSGPSYHKNLFLKECITTTFNQVSLGVGADAEERSKIETWVFAHGDAYQSIGKDNRTLLYTLALKEPKAHAFIQELPFSYPAKENVLYDEPLEKDVVPRLYQWDTRWAYKEYSSAPFGLTGCCPTSFSMVYMGLTGKSDITPGVAADMAREGGFMSESQGTIGDFLTRKASSVGLTCFTSPLTVDSLREGLKKGYFYICNVGPGDFTQDGHFFVITGIDEEGFLHINDPYSESRSDQVWDAHYILGQTIALYALACATE